MRIGITTCGCDNGRSGIGRYLIRLLDEFARLAEDDTFELIADEEGQRVFLPEGSPIEVHEPSCLPSHPIKNILWHQFVLPRLTRRRKYDVLFLPAANRRLPWRVACPTVGTIHDFSWLHMKNKYDRARMVYLTRVLPRQMSQLDWALTVSESSKRDILENTRLPKERVVVTPLAADTFACQADEDRQSVLGSVATRWGIDQPYWFYLSRLEHPGKNHIRLIRAFEKLKREYDLPHRLVFAGGDFLGAHEIHRAIEESPFRDQIVRTGFVDDAEVRQLFLGADLFVFPSLYEGFGLPVLEAMQLGVPVACGNRSSLPEVGGDAPLYFNPNNVDEMAAAISTLLFDEELRQRQIQRGLRQAKEFSWQKTARATLGVLRAAGCGFDDLREAEAKREPEIEEELIVSK